MQPCSGLQCKRMKRRRQIGGGEENSSGAKDDADEALSMEMLLWRISTSKALMSKQEHKFGSTNIARDNCADSARRGGGGEV